MKVKVRFFATLREVFGGEEKVVELKDGSNIQDLLDDLCRSQRCRQVIFDSSGKPEKYIQIMKNRQPIQSFHGIHTRLGEGDVVSIVPPTLGG